MHKTFDPRKTLREKPMPSNPVNFVESKESEEKAHAELLARSAKD